MENGSFIKQLWPTFSILILSTFLLGFIYPSIVTVVNQVTFHHQANGSLLRHKKIIASELIGQEFTSSKYFWCRPSSTTPIYNAASSTGSNLSLSNPTLITNINQRIDALTKAYPSNNQPIPIDLVTSSGSGLDPHISVAAALYQVNRVATARHVDDSVIRQFVFVAMEPRQFGFLGEPRVNVVKLNLLLDRANSLTYGT